VIACSDSNSHVPAQATLAIPTAPGNTVALSEITDFSWDRVFVFRPYRSPDEIARTVGFEWNSDAVEVIGYSDAHCLFLFVRDGTVEREALVSRRPDCASLDNSGGYAHAEARFIVQQGATADHPVLVPAAE